MIKLSENLELEVLLPLIRDRERKYVNRVVWQRTETCRSLWNYKDKNGCRQGWKSFTIFKKQVSWFPLQRCLTGIYHYGVKRGTRLKSFFKMPLVKKILPNSHTMERPWARGEPPPHGSLSRRFLAIAIDLEGGRRTSAESPRKGMIDTYLKS